VPLILEECHLGRICAILGQYLNNRAGCVRVYVYGSRAKGTAHKFSDVDLAIESERPIDRQTLSELRNAFAESDLPYAVDVTDMAYATAIFRNNVVRNRELIFKV
jgi:type I restriction enzyme S subunit